MSDDAERSGDPWEDKPDRWQEADERWEQWDEDEVAPATLARSGPEPDPVTPVQAYARGMTEAGPYLGLGLQIAGSMALFTGGGYLLDHRLGTRPWGMLLGATLAFVGIIVLVVRLGKTGKETSESREPREPRE